MNHLILFYSALFELFIFIVKNTCTQRNPDSKSQKTMNTHLECWRSVENGMDATSIVISVFNKPSDQRSRWRRPRPVETSNSSRKHTRLHMPPSQLLKHATYYRPKQFTINYKNLNWITVSIWRLSSVQKTWNWLHSVQCSRETITRNVGQCPTWWLPWRIQVAPSVQRRR